MKLPSLPEPSSFTLDEIAERWGCLEEQLIRYFQSDMLLIQVELTGGVGYMDEVISFEDGQDSYKPIKLDGLYSIDKSYVVSIWNMGEDPYEEYAPKITTVYDHENKQIKLQYQTIISSTKLRVSKNERDRFEQLHNMNIDNNSHIQKDNLDTMLEKSEYWTNLQQKTKSAIEQYPEWQASQRKIQKTGNLMDWLRETIGVDSREAEIIKKVVTDIYN